MGILYSNVHQLPDWFQNSDTFSAIFRIPTSSKPNLCAMFAPVIGALSKYRSCLGIVSSRSIPVMKKLEEKTRRRARQAAERGDEDRRVKERDGEKWVRDRAPASGRKQTRCSCWRGRVIILKVCRRRKFDAAGRPEIGLVPGVKDLGQRSGA